MVETRQTKKQLFGPCPLYQDGFSGPCEGCVQRTECILLTVLHKVESLESKFHRKSKGV